MSLQDAEGLQEVHRAAQEVCQALAVEVGNQAQASLGERALWGR